MFIVLVKLCIPYKILLFMKSFYGSTPILCLCFQVQNGATFIKVDKIDLVKYNSPALLFQGLISCVNRPDFSGFLWSMLESFISDYS